MPTFTKAKTKVTNGGWKQHTPLEIQWSVGDGEFDLRFTIQTGWYASEYQKELVEKEQHHREFVTTPNLVLTAVSSTPILEGQSKQGDRHYFTETWDKETPKRLFNILVDEGEERLVEELERERLDKAKHYNVLY